MIRDTSIEAYHTIIDNGMLSKRRAQVYTILFEKGPLAGAQVAFLFQERHGRTARSETIRNRITELRDMGVVKEVGVTQDPKTKMTVILWDVTSKLPIKLEKKETKTQVIARQFREITELKEEINRLHESISFLRTRDNT